MPEKEKVLKSRNIYVLQKLFLQKNFKYIHIYKSFIPGPPSKDQNKRTFRNFFERNETRKEGRKSSAPTRSGGTDKVIMLSTEEISSKFNNFNSFPIARISM